MSRYCNADTAWILEQRDHCDPRTVAEYIRVANAIVRNSGSEIL